MAKASEWNPGRLALIGAALIALIAIGIAVARSMGAFAPRPAETAAAQPAGSIDDSIGRLEARLKDNPQDVEGWQMLGFGYFETGRYAEAATAYRRTVALAPNNATFWASLGEAIVHTATERVMPPEAAKAFDKALSLDPKDPRARYWKAAQKDLAGDGQGAIDAWFALLADTPAGSPWEQGLRETIKTVGGKYKIDTAARLAAVKPAAPAPGGPAIASAGIPGPSAADMAAASKLPPGQQEAMVAGMVNGLEAKLKTDPANVQGWMMLMRSRMTLGEAQKAAAAYRSAVAANPGARGELAAAAKELGVPGA